jgi:serine/threonine protein kinase
VMLFHHAGSSTGPCATSFCVPGIPASLLFVDGVIASCSSCFSSVLPLCCLQLLLHGRASRASDVYAMGCLLYHVATGRRVFASESPAAATTNPSAHHSLQ